MSASKYIKIPLCIADSPNLSLHSGSAPWRSNILAHSRLPNNDDDDNNNDDDDDKNGDDDDGDDSDDDDDGDDVMM
jgi:hypothetical protein